MTTSNSISNQVAVSDLPRPDGVVDNVTTQPSLPRALPKVTDSGRISFGAGFRLLSK